MPSTVGYCRVSSREQSDNTAALEQQKARVKEAGAEEILVDVESGRSGREDERPELCCGKGCVIANGLGEFEGCRVSVSKVFKAAAAAIALPEELSHPHVLRHTRGYLMVEKGYPLRVIQEWLGHQQIQHTVRYTACSVSGCGGLNRYNQ